MKVFHYDTGHEAGSTMTVAELRAKLSEYPDDMPVFGAWEGVCGYVQGDKFRVEMFGHGNDECECLLIDVEEY